MRLDLTADLLRSGDHTVLVIEHDMEHRLESPVTVLHQGSVLREGSMDQSAGSRVIEVYLGTREDAS